jgi:hypothetical protein
MAVRIARVDKKLNLIKRYGFIKDEKVIEIVDFAKKNNFKCLLFLDYCDHTFFNNTQWPELIKEIKILEKEKILSENKAQALYDCYKDVIFFSNQLFAFIGD